MTESIAILDFGSQYAQIIARRVREANVYCELFRGIRRRKKSSPSTPRDSSSPAGQSQYMKRTRHISKNLF